MLFLFSKLKSKLVKVAVKVIEHERFVFFHNSKSQSTFDVNQLLIFPIVAFWESGQDHMSHLSASGTSSNPKSWLLLKVRLARGDTINKEAIQKLKDSLMLKPVAHTLSHKTYEPFILKEAAYKPSTY